MATIRINMSFHFIEPKAKLEAKGLGGKEKEKKKILTLRLLSKFVDTHNSDILVSQKEKTN